MKVLHWYPNFLGGGGVANAVLGLAKAQAELGTDVAIASAESAGTPLYQAMDEHLERVQLFRWKPKKQVRVAGLNWRVLPREAVEIRAFQPDIIHVHGEFNPDNFWVPHLFDAPFVLSPHGAFHPVVLPKSKRIAKRLYIELAKRMLYTHSLAFHAVSPAEEEHIKSAVGRARIYTVPQGASPHVFVLQKRSNSSQGGELVRLVFVGRLDIYTRGLDILIEAFAQALKAMPERRLHLTLIGPDWKGSMNRLRELAERYECAPCISFTGAVLGNQVAEILDQSDIYVHLSRHEVFSLSIAEALIAGKPSILSSEVGMVSWPEIRNLPFVKVVPPEAGASSKAIVEFVENIETLTALLPAWEDKIKNFFNWKRVAQAHLECYGEILCGVRRAT